MGGSAQPGRDPTPRGEFALVLAADDRVARGLAVALHSALTHMPPDARPLVYVLDNGLSESSWVRVARAVDRLGRGDELRRIPISPERVADLPGHSRITVSTYLRFLIPEVVLPGTLCALYLDTDVLVRRDLSPLFQIDLGDAPLGAVRDLSIGTTANPRSGLADRVAARPYFNNGVLLIDVRAWTTRRIGERALELLEADDSGFPFMDQGALNLIADTWQELDGTWNLQLGNVALTTRRLLADPRGYFADRATYRDAAVLHFTGGAKPWQ